MEFGNRLPGQHYQPRLGSYAVAVRDDGRVAIIETPRGCFLPGGGAQPGESPEETLAREVWEECGCETEIIGPIGFATEYVFAPGEGHLAKQCLFFRVKLGKCVQAGTESDHRLIWLTITEAGARLVHGSHVWALSNAETGNSLNAKMRRSASP